MKVQTGKGYVSALTVVAIWTLSLGINLPGLAVTPMLQSVQEIFGAGNVSQLEVELLEMIPNIAIVPMLLIGGWLAMRRQKLLLVGAALLIYALAGVLYLFCNTMAQLIWVSALLGIGCGLLLPFATGLVADVFTGKYRLKQMGIISALGNLSLVGATLLVGILAERNWHLPFLVYLIPVVSLLMMPWLAKIPKADLYDEQPIEGELAQQLTSQKCHDKVWRGFYLGRISGIMAIYFAYVLVFAGVASYTSFLSEDLGLSPTSAGIITAAQCMGVFVGGMILAPWIRGWKLMSFDAAAVCVLLGCISLGLAQGFALAIIGSSLVGFGLGIIQPIIYDKAPECVTQPKMASLALGVALIANYIGIALCPVVIDATMHLFGAVGEAHYPFWFAAVISGLLVLCGFIWRKRFLFNLGDHPLLVEKIAQEEEL